MTRSIAILLLAIAALAVAAGGFQTAPEAYWLLGYMGSQQWVRLGPTLKTTQTGRYYQIDIAGTPGQMVVGGGLRGTGSPDSPLSLDTAAVPARSSATATLSFPNLAQGACNEQQISLAGASTGDEVSLGAPANIDQGLQWSGYVSVAGVVKVRLCKLTPGSVTPIVGSWRATIVRSW